MGRRKQVDSEPLFGLEEWREPVVLPAGLSRSKRRTAEKRQRIAIGVHPLTGLPLFPGAPADTNRSKRLPQFGTCGTCLHLSQMPGIVRSSLDCELSTHNGGARRWWPACMQYRPRRPRDEAGSDDPTASQ